MLSSETEIDLLERIDRSQSPVRQRDLAGAIGLSLGMTNAILKRLAKKGWLTIRKVNNRSLQYVVSREGAEEIARRSYRYLRRTIGNIVRFKEAIETVIREAARRGCTEVVLIGESDLEFILEHACAGRGLAFRPELAGEAGRVAPSGRGANVLVVYSEGRELSELDYGAGSFGPAGADPETGSPESVVYLGRMLAELR